MNYIEKLEEVRIANELSWSDMGREFGVIYQNYKNWVLRGSLPKSQQDRALDVIRKYDPTERKKAVIIEKLDQLSPEGLDLAVDQIETALIHDKAKYRDAP